MIYLMALVVCLFSGCEKGDEYEPSPRENFEALWKILDENYCFFSYKQVDWDEVHERYSPLITDTMSQIALFDTLANMTNELKDGHTNLVSQFNTSRYWDWYLDYPDNFDSKIQENYLLWPTGRSVMSITAAFPPRRARMASIMSCSPSRIARD